MKKAKMEMKTTMSRDKYKGADHSVDTNEESTGTISKKHFGHVMKTAKALHGSDPGFNQHKR